MQGCGALTLIQMPHAAQLLPVNHGNHLCSHSVQEPLPCESLFGSSYCVQDADTCHTVVQLAYGPECRVVLGARWPLLCHERDAWSQACDGADDARKPPRFYSFSVCVLIQRLQGDIIVFIALLFVLLVGYGVALYTLMWPERDWDDTTVATVFFR